MLVTSIFSFSHIVFYPTENNFKFFIKIATLKHNISFLAVKKSGRKYRTGKDLYREHTYSCRFNNGIGINFGNLIHVVFCFLDKCFAFSLEIKTSRLFLAYVWVITTISDVYYYPSLTLLD